MTFPHGNQHHLSFWKPSETAAYNWTKLSMLKELVSEQLKIGHLEPSKSKHNTFMHYCQEIRTLQPPAGSLLMVYWKKNEVYTARPPLNTSAIPPSCYIPVLNIKNCVFQFSLVPQNRYHFAFTVWESHMHNPAKSYQWTVLPQGTKNSPTICLLRWEMLV